MTKSKRDKEAVRLQPLVRKIALRLRRTLPPSVELDDLISEGTVGLIDALKRYDGQRGVKVEHFAAMRIRGSMLDWLRREDPRSRPQREKQRAEAASGPEWTESEPVPDVEDLSARACSQFDLCLNSELRAALERAARRLNWREREIIALHYGSEITQDRIATRLQVDPSRISQLHSMALTKMRSALGNAQRFLP